MPLEPNVRRLVLQALALTDATGAGDATRLSADAQRLWRRVEQFLGWGLVHHNPDLESLELCCLGLQLPMRRTERLPVGRLGVMNLRERAETAALRLIEEIGAQIDAPLLDRATRLLFETPQRPPVLEDAKLLADAVNLDDFGAGGVVRQAIEIGLRGGGMELLAEGWEKRAAYGYWEARLRDGFHFAEVRDLARRRYDNARRVADMLVEEHSEDGA